MRAGLLLAALGFLAAGSAAAKDLDRAAHADNGPPAVQAEGADGRDAAALRGEHEALTTMRDLVASQEATRDIE